MLLDQESLRFIFGLKLKSSRQEKGLSLKELASASGLSPSYINEIEKGKKYPKGEKVMVLARALGVSYDELISLRLKNELGVLSKFLERNLLKGLPLEVFGIPARTVFELMAEHPQKFSALLATVFEITRQHNISVENFFHATLRAYIDMHGNYFPELEDKVEEFRKDHPTLTTGQMSAENLKTFLQKNFGRKVVEMDFSAESPALKNLYFFHEEEKKKRLFLNRELSDREKIFILAKEIGYAVLRAKERIAIPGISELDSYSPLYNNFAASYFASALLIPREKIVAEAKDFLGNSQWDEGRLLRWVQSYPGTHESFFHRLAQVLPSFFGIERLFFIRYNYLSRTNTFELSRELHLTELHAPYRLEHTEHYCRRWISTRLLKELTAKTPELAGAQRSNFFQQGQEYLCLSVANPHELKKDEYTCSTLGLLVNPELRQKVHFLEDKSIQLREVGHTCEQCPLENCKERAAPPTQEDKRKIQAEITQAVRKLLAVNS